MWKVFYILYNVFLAFDFGCNCRDLCYFYYYYVPLEIGKKCLLIVAIIYDGGAQDERVLLYCIAEPHIDACQAVHPAPRMHESQRVDPNVQVATALRLQIDRATSGDLVRIACRRSRMC